MGGWEGGIRVVGVAKLPGVIPAGQDITVPTSQMDVFATIADLAEVQVPQDRVIDGRSMIPLLSGKSKDTTHEILVHHCGTAIHAARYAPKGSEFSLSCFQKFKIIDAKSADLLSVSEILATSACI